MPQVEGPDAPGTTVTSSGAHEVGTIAGTALASPDDTAPAALATWGAVPRSPHWGSSDIAGIGRVATNFPFVGIAMRPHRGLDVSQSHLTVSTGVLTHSISFHEPFEASQWLLLDEEVPYAGNGRFYGRGHAFTEDGGLVASFAQDGMVRPLAAPGSHGASSSL